MKHNMTRLGEIQAHQSTVNVEVWFGVHTGDKEDDDAITVW